MPPTWTCRTEVEPPKRRFWWVGWRATWCLYEATPTTLSRLVARTERAPIAVGTCTGRTSEEATAAAEAKVAGLARRRVQLAEAIHERNLLAPNHGLRTRRELR